MNDTPKKKTNPNTFLRYLPDDHEAYRDTSWTVFIPMRVRVEPPPTDDQVTPAPKSKGIKKRKR